MEHSSISTSMVGAWVLPTSSSRPQARILSWHRCFSKQTNVDTELAFKLFLHELCTAVQRETGKQILLRAVAVCFSRRESLGQGQHQLHFRLHLPMCTI